MFGPWIPVSVRQQMDRLVLSVLNRRVPDTFEENTQPPSLEEVLDATRVNRAKTAVTNVVAPGETLVHLDTAMGAMTLRTRTRLHANPNAPVIIYHHGLAEVPYDSSWRRLFPREMPFPAHAVVVQAPFHDLPTTPVEMGFASLLHIYQMFAGSLRLIELMQDEFEASGAGYTVVSGLSWGGITSILYQGLLQRARAVIPMFASPNLAQVLVDISEMFNRPLPADRERLDAYLDFTPVYERCDKERFFPVLGEHDQFFRFDHHRTVFDDDAMRLDSAHVGAASFNRTLLQDHIRKTLVWADAHPLPG